MNDQKKQIKHLRAVNLKLLQRLNEKTRELDNLKRQSGRRLTKNCDALTKLWAKI